LIEEAKKFDIAGPQWALATARIISDIILSLILKECPALIQH